MHTSETRKPSPVALRDPSQRGVASLLAVAGMAVIMLTLIAALVVIQTSARSVGGQLKVQGQTYNVAMAGATDGLSWFQEQTTQPVTVFSPQRNLAATPPINDTESTSIGIVRTFPVSDLGNVWGRYEDRKSVV